MGTPPATAAAGPLVHSHPPPDSPSMRPLSLILAAAAVSLFPPVAAAHPGHDHPAPATRPAGEAVGVRTPATSALAAAERRIAADPGQAAPYLDAAAALVRRARETGDDAHYGRAAEMLGRAYAIDPESYAAKRIEATVLLGRGEFAQARDLATELNERARDDLLVYAVLTDANVALGNYAEAEAAAQMMLDLRPNVPLSLVRGAAIREVIGDPSGAAEFLADALARTPANEIEERAWLLTEVGRLAMEQGQLDVAEATLEAAMEVFPDYHHALALKADVRLARGEAGEAAALRRQHAAAVSDPDAAHFLAEALAGAGDDAAAERAYADFESAASDAGGTARLVLHYATDGDRSAEALRLGEALVQRRQDVRTLDAYAMALHAVGRHDDARREVERALGVGVRDAEILYHAAVIAAAQGDAAAAADFARRSLDANPHSRAAADARAMLEDPTR